MLVVPDLAAPLSASVPASSVTEVALSVDGKTFRFWERIRITRTLDAMDSAEFTAPFESDAPGFRDTFRPLSFKSFEVTLGGAPLFTGTTVGVNPVLEPTIKSVSVTGYSKPGVLVDCTPPASSYPIEFNDVKLNEIVASLLYPFGLQHVFTADQGPIFERVACEPGRRVYAFLADLARQRGLVVSSTPEGELLFQKSIDGGQPVASLVQGEQPLISVSPSFNPQDLYSHITGIEPVIVGLKGSNYTVVNPTLRGVVRPLTFTPPDTLDSDVKEAVDAKAGRMMANAATFVVVVATWRDPQGAVWTPNTTINLKAPDAMVYESYEFLIRSVQLDKDSTSETAKLSLVFIGAFSGVMPEVLPWDL
jgi:prophage tail gpP-like protein